MPLLKSPSKKAFSKNVKVEMEAGKPQKQSLAIAYEIKRKNAKKMFKGGDVNDKHNIAENSHEGKSAFGDMWDQNPSTHEDKKSPELSRPAQKGSDSFDKRYQNELKYDLDRMDTEEPMGHETMAPKESYDEVKMADGGMIDADSITPEEMRMIHEYRMMADGGEVSNLKEHDDGEMNTVVDSIMAKRRGVSNDVVDLSRNADEDLNNEDDLSFKAGHDKQNYRETEQLDEMHQPEDSNMKGHDAEDEHDESIVGSIRKRMKAKRGM